MVASWVCDVTLDLMTTQKMLLQCFFFEDFSDLTSPTSNLIYLAISVVYDACKTILRIHVELFNPSFWLSNIIECVLLYVTCIDWLINP